MSAADRHVVLVIEFQKTWTEPGLFHRMIRRQLEDRDVVANAQSLLAAARASDVPIVHAPLILDPSADRYRRAPLLPRLARQFRAGTVGSEYAPGVFGSTDIEVQGRVAFDATIGSDLIPILEDLEPERVDVLGFTTDHCVAFTIDALTDRGFDCQLVADCTATKSARLQRRTESRFPVISCRELMAEFDGLQEAGPAP